MSGVFFETHCSISLGCGAGDWEIMILYDGEHVDGSPFTVRVCDPGDVKVSGLASGIVDSEVVFSGKHTHHTLLTFVS